MLPKPISEGLFRRVICEGNMLPKPISEGLFRRVIFRIGGWRRFKEDLSTQLIDPQDPSLPDFAPEVAEIPRDSQIAIPEMASASTPKRKQQPNSTTTELPLGARIWLADAISPDARSWRLRPRRRLVTGPALWLPRHRHRSLQAAALRRLTIPPKSAPLSKVWRYVSNLAPALADRWVSRGKYAA